MDVAQFAEFWRRQGYRVIQTTGGYWYSPHSFSFMSLPYHRLVTPTRRDLTEVLLRGPAVVIRFPTVASGTGKETGLFVCSDRTYDLTSLHQKSRNQARRGLENCTVEQVDFGYLAAHGHSLNVETFRRQGRDPHTITEPHWRRYCEAASRITGFEAWGAFVQKGLTAFMVTALVEDCFSILCQSSATEHLDRYPNNALVFTVVKQKLSRPDVTFVSYGLKSLDDTPGLDRFKLNMGFTLQPREEGIVVNPLLKPFLVVGGDKAINWMARRHPESDLWRKAAKILRLTAGELSVQ